MIINYGGNRHKGNYCIEIKFFSNNQCYTLNKPYTIRGGGALKAPPPPIFCSFAFNFGAALLCVGDFSQKIV